MNKNAFGIVSGPGKRFSAAITVLTASAIAIVALLSMMMMMIRRDAATLYCEYAVYNFFLQYNSIQFNEYIILVLFEHRSSRIVDFYAIVLIWINNSLYCGTGKSVKGKSPLFT